MQPRKLRTILRRFSAQLGDAKRAWKPAFGFYSPYAPFEPFEAAYRAGANREVIRQLLKPLQEVTANRGKVLEDKLARRNIIERFYGNYDEHAFIELKRYAFALAMLKGEQQLLQFMTNHLSTQGAIPSENEFKRFKEDTAKAETDFLHKFLANAAIRRALAQNLGMATVRRHRKIAHEYLVGVLDPKSSVGELRTGLRAIGLDPPAVDRILGVLTQTLTELDSITID